METPGASLLPTSSLGQVTVHPSSPSEPQVWMPHQEPQDRQRDTKSFSTRLSKQSGPPPECQVSQETLAEMEICLRGTQSGRGERVKQSKGQSRMMQKGRFNTSKTFLEIGATESVTTERTVGNQTYLTTTTKKEFEAKC